MLSSVLIANRGEIACRIIRTCRRLGVRTVAVYSDADRDARHVRLADDAVHLGPPPAHESYLDIAKLLDAARRTGAEAVHPGYGFLSERAAFARAVGEAGLVWVGPPAAAIEAMGGKDRAKQLMRVAGVPVVPGYDGDEQDAATLLAAAERMGFPVLLKAAAGGGGKGMRIVEAVDGFEDALAGARREAQGAFGDDRMLVEKYLRRPRHVEMQVFAASHGNTVHLFERDCSLQRRHQKIVEEAPAPDLLPETRATLWRSAVEAARAVGYVNAGTVEFLVDEDGAAYFIEMNTRLQVEHPVTEMITGLDLVEWQLRVASGEPLPLAQEQIRAQGHSIEARVYAEDATRGFLPSVGRLERLVFPEPSEALRIETGVEEGDEVSPFYDPMIAKLVVHGNSRAGALRRLADVLDRSLIVGPVTNLGFLRAVVASTAFAAGPVDTGWLDRAGTGEILAGMVPEDQDFMLGALAVQALAGGPAMPGERRRDWTSPWNRRDGWRLNRSSRQLVRLQAGERQERLAVARDRDGTVVSLGGSEIRARMGGEEGELWAEIDGRRLRFRAHLADDRLALVRAGRRVEFRLADDRPAVREEEEGADLRVAPMPGRVIRLMVGAGDAVRKGQPLAILEAMKMEQRIEAPHDGRVSAVHVAEGEQIAEGTRLLDLVEAEAPP